MFSPESSEKRSPSPSSASQLASPPPSPPPASSPPCSSAFPRPMSQPSQSSLCYSFSLHCSRAIYQPAALPPSTQSSRSVPNEPTGNKSGTDWEQTTEEQG